MTKRMKLSVLVPIFNTEKYLPECLDSLTAQSLSDIEILCINDGSTDDSLKIAQRYAKKDARIRIINKKNTGYGDSMNRGLAEAKGEYIAIVESDDFLAPEACEQLYAIANKASADVVRANYYYHSETGNLIHAAIRDQFLYHPQTILDDTAILYEEPAIWSGIYRRQFLQDRKIGFLTTPGASYQDTSFNFKALCAAEKIVYTDKAFLYYRVDNESSSVKSLEKADYVIQEYAEIERFLTETAAPQELRYIAQATKFGAFNWNLIRLPHSLAVVFLTRMKQNFRAAAQEGLLRKQYWPRKYWLGLQMILHAPTGFYYSALALRDKLKRQ